MEHKVRGQVAKIQTTADQCVRVVIDIPNEVAPDDIIKWLYATVELARQPDAYQQTTNDKTE